MNSPEVVFPANEFTLLLLIVVLPLVGAFVNGVFGKRLGKEAVTLMALVAVGGSFLASVGSFWALKTMQHGEHAARVYWKGWEWVRISTRHDSSSIPIEFSLSMDALSGTMALVVTGVGFLIHLYSTKYMAEDPGYHRFFAYLNLFIFSMLVLILGDSLPVLFVGWEGVGLCSYLLIGFWYEVDANASAGKKAFITNRIGDFGLLVAMGLLVYYAGALDWSGIENARQNLVQPVRIWPFGSHVPLADILPTDWAAVVNRPRYVNAATLVGLAVFLGCAGKSAQIPLYVWLPDAMAGPTPVSALIHAATMVTAGVYLVCRMAGVFVLSPAAMFTVALVGAVTAVFAATIAFVQNDIKKVLAYSTVSQLGYMFLGVGVGAFTAGFFHVLTHAFFKACLFLGAGSVIYQIHKRIHGTDASQDMRNMGGMRKFMPVTFLTFAASWAAIVGFPLTSGFFSKDEILFKAYTSSVAVAGSGTIGSGPSEITLFQWPSWAPTTLFTLGVAGAVMTAFYMTRLVIGIFFGEFRGWAIVANWKEPAHGHHEEAHAHDHEHGAHDHGEPLEGPRPTESPWQMTLPLAILGALAIAAGALNAHALFHFHPLDDWLMPVFEAAKGAVHDRPDAKALELTLLAPGLLAFVLGAGAAYWVYLMQKGEPARQLAERMPGLHRLVYEKWRIDELYEETVIGAVDSLAEFSVWFDRWVVDGIVARLTSFVVASTGTVLRYAQTGRVQAYAAVMVVGVGGLGWFLVLPHAEAKVHADATSGQQTLTAAPGLGYAYRWDANADDKWDTEEFGSGATTSVTLKPDETRGVRLQVRNAFGRVATKQFDLTRPKPDASRGGATALRVERGADGQLRGEPLGRPAPGAGAQRELPSDAAQRVLRALQQPQQQRQQP
jgi:NADH-quinone oxidoreductase subunit L